MAPKSGSLVKITEDVVDDGERVLIAGDVVSVIDVDDQFEDVLMLTVRARVGSVTTLNLGEQCELAPVGSAPTALA